MATLNVRDPSRFGYDPFQAVRDDTREVFALLADHGFFTEALVCLYSAIDAICWLTIDRRPDQTRQGDFVEWVRRHMDPARRLGVEPDSIYAARCTLVHQRISRHLLVSRGERTEIQYRFGEVLIGAPMIMISTAVAGGRDVPRTHHVVIRAEALLDAFVAAIESARAAAVAAGEEEWNRVRSRSQMFLLAMGSGIPHRIGRRDYPPDVQAAFGKMGERG